MTAFIPAPDPSVEMSEGCTADKDDNIYGGFTAKSDVKKWVKS